MNDKFGSSNIPEVDLSSFSIDEEVVKLIPASFARKNNVMPLFLVGNTLTIAIADTNNVLVLDDIRTLTNKDVSIVKSSRIGIEDAVKDAYGISDIVEEAVKNYIPPEEIKIKAKPKDQPPVVNLVNEIIMHAIWSRTSDIHIEPEKDDMKIRFRVDGVLHEEARMPAYMQAPVVSRIKVMAEMDISESRSPQDGRAALDIAGKQIDMRISSFPTVYGEKVVIRLLDKSSMVYSLEKIGFNGDNYARFTNAIHKPHGIILATGPTGSGKSTTLYAALQEIDRKKLNVTTVEDPIEYELPGITQSQVNVKAGLTFSTALRAILRQDPDVVLIGEIRDKETADISIQAALTGHLVFSTLHTNDSIGALARLVDMGVEPFLVSSSVEAILAQRLVRVVCPSCRKEDVPPDELRSLYPDLQIIYRANGCKKCRFTGYKGRSGIFEIFTIDDNIRKMISSKADMSDIKKYAISQGMRTLYDDGIERIKAGITTYDEVLRVTKLE